MEMQLYLRQAAKPFDRIDLHGLLRCSSCHGISLERGYSTGLICRRKDSECQDRDLVDLHGNIFMNRYSKLGIVVVVSLGVALALLVAANHRPANAMSLAEVALSHEGDTAYEAAKWNGWYRPGSNKCNKAVADWIATSGHPRPFVRGHFGLIPRDPSAHEWADPRVTIAGWSAPMPLADAQPGDVIAQQHGPVYGHVGIVAGPGMTVSAYGEVRPQGLVLKNDWGFRTAPEAKRRERE
jgi:hypothetical protein